MPEIYVRERDKQDAKIREFEKRFKALENDNQVLRQRLAVIEDKFREPVSTEKKVRKRKVQVSGT
jgi:hypothetical protein